jgi:formiminotetrahydrofolate cyclodeaminase
MVPRSVAATALNLLSLSVDVAEKSNRWLLSDLAVCGELAMACLRAAHHNVRVNLASVDEATRDQLKQEMDRQSARGVEMIRRLIPMIHRIQDGA